MPGCWEQTYRLVGSAEAEPVQNLWYKPRLSTGWIECLPQTWVIKPAQSTRLCSHTDRASYASQQAEETWSGRVQLPQVGSRSEERGVGKERRIRRVGWQPGG